MRWLSPRLTTSPTDLANFLACRTKTALDLRAARGEIAAPHWRDPHADVLAAHGRQHERRYIDALRQQGRSIRDLTGLTAEAAEVELVSAMHEGVDVIVQAPLSALGWSGVADALVRVDGRATFGPWHYEAHDTKLSRETRGGTILQLCVYSELLAAIQGRAPESFAVVTPAGTERYRLSDFAAFYRVIREAFLRFLEARGEPAAVTVPYPEPCDHCQVCRWWGGCDERRRKDDHLSFVAGLGAMHRLELARHQVTSLTALAELPVPIPFTPERGAPETYARLREQARLQLERRRTGRATFELLEVRAHLGLALLPEPNPGDLFLDLEGDPFGRRASEPGWGLAGESSREYLFGLGRVERDGRFTYTCWWAFTDEDERAAFDAVLTEIMAAMGANQGAHVYHYAAYEPAAFRRLMGRHAWREADVDTLLRGGRFVDLYAVVRHAVRVGAEGYSLKDLEACYDFERDLALDHAGDQRRIIEFALELGETGAIGPGVRAAVETYNRDDCRSTWALRQWLERLRAAVARTGVDLPRPTLSLGAPTDRIATRDAASSALRKRLFDGLPPAGARTPEQQAQWLVAHLADWFRREERVGWGEYHRLREKSEEELEDEPLAITGLEFEARVFAPINVGRVRSGIDRYRFPPQELDIRVGDQLRLTHDEVFGTVHALDKVAGTIEIKKSSGQADVHPTALVALTVVTAPEQEASVYRVAHTIMMAGVNDREGDPLVNDLLLARPPRLRFGVFRSIYDEAMTEFVIRTVRNLDHSVLAVQGPPGSGKTYTAARLITALLAEGKNVGVVAASHKVIRKLLTDIVAQAARVNTALAVAHKVGDEPVGRDGDGVREFSANDDALDWIKDTGAGVLGGTAWMWSRQDFAGAVDVLVVDEAGQMSLATVLAVSQAAQNLVLFGDPRQLEQPQRAVHPDGVDVSALDHLLAGHQTIPPERGVFLPMTRRLAPGIAAFTSEVFYDGKLKALPGLDRQRLLGTARFDGAGLWLLEVEHDGCRNASAEEADAVALIIDELLCGTASWINEQGLKKPLTAHDILVVAPYNAHVRCLRDRIAQPVSIGSVDRFQGQEAPVVIYAMAASRPEDAPRGMEFLYSANRLNVATSRARCACILVASPRLFDPACDTPRQMHLANALCRYREMATVLPSSLPGS